MPESIMLFAQPVFATRQGYVDALSHNGDFMPSEVSGTHSWI
jgi:hypothetical protein